MLFSYCCCFLACDDASCPHPPCPLPSVSDAFGQIDRLYFSRQMLAAGKIQKKKKPTCWFVLLILQSLSITLTAVQTEEMHCIATTWTYLIALQSFRSFSYSKRLLNRDICCACRDTCTFAPVAGLNLLVMFRKTKVCLLKRLSGTLLFPCKFFFQIFMKNMQMSVHALLLSFIVCSSKKLITSAFPFILHLQLVKRNLQTSALDFCKYVMKFLCLQTRAGT